MELGDSLIRLARKLQQQNKKPDQEQAEDLRALHAKLIDLRSYIDVVKRELGPQRYCDEAYAKATATFAQIAQTFVQHQFQHIYIVDGQRKLLGAVSLHDVKALLDRKRLVNPIWRMAPGFGKS
jgi:hypothetical protein